MSVLSTGICGSSGVASTQSERARLSTEEQAVTTRFYAAPDASARLIWTWSRWVSAIYYFDLFCHHFLSRHCYLFVAPPSRTHLPCELVICSQYITMLINTLGSIVLANVQKPPFVCFMSTHTGVLWGASNQPNMTVSYLGQGP